MARWLRRLRELRLNSSIWVINQATGEDAVYRGVAQYFTGHSGRDRLPRDPGGLTVGERAGNYPPVEGRRSDSLQTSRQGSSCGWRWRAEVRCGGREGAKPSGWSAAGAGDRDWPEDGTGSAERNPDQKAAGGVTKESLRREDITTPATPRDVPAVRRTLGRVRRGFGGAPGGAATRGVHRTREARFWLFLKRAAEPSRAKPSLMPAREELMVYWSRRFHIPHG